MYSSSLRGRRPTSYWASSSTRAAVTSLSLLTGTHWDSPWLRNSPEIHRGTHGKSGDSLGQFSQSLFQCALEPRFWRDLERGGDGLFGERPMITQVQERGEHIVAN